MSDSLIELGVRVGIAGIAGISMLGARQLAVQWQARRRRRVLASAPAPDVTQGEATVLLFSGARCSDCVRQREILLEMRGRSNGWRLREVQAADEVHLARRFGVESVPATVILDGSGQPVAVNYGLVEEGVLAQQLRSVDLRPPVAALP